MSLSVRFLIWLFLVPAVHTSMPADVRNMYSRHACTQATQTKSERVLLIKDSEYCSESLTVAQLFLNLYF